jgi:hypothetical protein
MLCAREIDACHNPVIAARTVQRYLNCRKVENEVVMMEAYYPMDKGWYTAILLLRQGSLRIIDTNKYKLVWS